MWVVYYLISFHLDKFIYSLPKYFRQDYHWDVVCYHPCSHILTHTHTHTHTQNTLMNEFRTHMNEIVQEIYDNTLMNEFRTHMNE